GSTGKPKGVVITHQAVTNTIIDINSKFKVNARDRFIGLSSMSFDLSIYDIFGAFSVGATLVMIEDQRDVKTIYHTVKENGITVWNSVPMIME
ncbi:AMP-binding protein, partial [Bacillus vallismortis]|nr:AMP-binding protein [Bacillus vallismortis]